MLRHQLSRRRFDGLPRGLGLLHLLQHHVPERGERSVGVSECENRRAGSLGEKRLGASDHARHQGGQGEPVLQGEDHHVVQHPILFHGGDTGLEVDEQYVGHAVALLHELGGVVAPGHDAMDVLVCHLGQPLERRAFVVEGYGPVLALHVVEGQLGAAEISDHFLVPGLVVHQSTHFLYSPEVFWALAYSGRSS